MVITVASYVSVPLPRDNKIAYVPMDAAHLFPNSHQWSWNPQQQNLVDEKTNDVFPLLVNTFDDREIFYRGIVHPRGVAKQIETFLASMRITQERKNGCCG